MYPRFGLPAPCWANPAEDTPEFLNKKHLIFRNYIIKTMRATKIQVRAKSRSGITSAAFRFDVASASKIAATAIDDEPESLNEGFKEKLKSLALKWLKGFKDYLRRWFMKNIGNIIKKILPIFDVSFQ